MREKTESRTSRTVGWRKTESDIKSTTERGGHDHCADQTCVAAACFHGNRHLGLYRCVTGERA